MERLKELRTKRHLLQKDVAAVLGIDRTTYVKYENGLSEPSYDILCKLAEYFEVSTDYLLGRDDAIKNVSPTMNDLKVALFGGDGEVTDEMWDEVKNFAQYVKSKRKDEK